MRKKKMVEVVLWLLVVGEMKEEMEEEEVVEFGVKMVEKWVAKGGRRKSLAAGCLQPWLSVGRNREEKSNNEGERRMWGGFIRRGKH